MTRIQDTYVPKVFSLSKREACKKSFAMSICFESNDFQINKEEYAF